MIQEKTLLEASLRGDTAAFERIVVQYQALVCSIALSATGRLDTSEELAQETFLRAWKSLGQLKELDKFRSWLCSITRNCIQNYLRDQKRQAAVISGSVEMVEAVPCGSESIPERLIRQEEEAMMQQALMRIPQDYRDVLVLFYRQQQSVAQVAAMLELTESNVRTRLHRGRELLREEVASRIERTLERTAPGKDFTKAVMVALGGLTLGAAATSQAAGVSTTATGTSTFLTGVGIKIAAAAAAVIIGAGAWIYYANLPDKTEAIEPVALDSRLPEKGTMQPLADVKKPIAEMLAAESKAEIPAAEPIIEKSQPQLPVPKTIAEPNNAYEFKPRGVLSGLITDIETGRPVTDAKIKLCNSNCEVAKTDEHGFYYFDTIEKDGNYSLTIESIDYVGLYGYRKQPRVNLQKDKQAVQHFQFHKACKLEIQVIDEVGRPIEKAHIYSTALSDSYKTEIGTSIYVRQTDKEGKALLCGFPPNDYYLITVTHNGPDIKVQDKPLQSLSGKWDYAPAGLKIYLDKPGQTEYAEVVLEKGQPVAGFAKYKDGLPADGVKISAYPDWWHSNYWPQSVEVEANGFFALEQIVPGNYQIHVSIPTGEGSSTGRGLFNCVLPLENDKLLDVPVPFNSPASLASIRGKLKVFGDKKPSYVNLDVESKSQRSSLRIADGRWDDASKDFVVDRLEPGICSLRFFGDEIEEKTLENITAPAEGLEVVLVYIGKMKLSGIVVDVQTKQPIQKFEVRIKKLQTLRGDNYNQPDQWAAFIDKEGRFEVEIVGPGIYQVQAQAKDYAPVWSDEVNTDQNKSITIALAAGGGSIRGVVLNEEGLPVKDAKVIPLSLAGGTDWRNKDSFMLDKGVAATNEKGEFVLTGLSAGYETLKATHPDYTFTIVRDIQTILGQCTDNIKIILQSGGIVEGYVYDADGLPLEGEVIYAQDDYGYRGNVGEEAGRLGTATSDPNGYYRIANLPEQVCCLKRQNEWNVSGVIRRTIFVRLGKTARVDFGGPVCLRGQVVLEGKPLVNEKLLLASDGNPHFGNFKANSSTDTEGKFIFRGLVPGRLAVYYRQADSTMEQADSAMEWVKAASIYGSDKDMDLGIIPKGFAVLRVTIRHPEPAWNISRVYLVKDKAVSEALMAKPPVIPEEPYVISPAAAGTYKLQIHREDGLIFNQDVVVPENQELIYLKVGLPAGTARLYGALSAGQTYAILFSEDKMIQKSIYRNTAGSYEVGDLPQGKYYLGVDLSLDEGNSLSFYLSEGQQLMMKLDDDSFEKYSVGMLYVQTVSADGQLIEEAQACLKTGGRTVEPRGQSGSEAIFMTQVGQYMLHVSCEGYKDIRQEVSLNALKTGEIPYPKKNKITVFLESKK